MHTTLIEQDKVHRDQQLQAEQKALQLIQRCTAAEKLFSECQTQIEKLTQVNAAVEKQAQERAQQVEQLSKVRDEQVKLTQEHQTQIKQLTQAKAAAEKQAQEQTQQAAQLSKACNEQARLVQERQTQIEQLMQVKAAAERQAQERDPQIEQLSKACDEQARLTKEHRTQIEQLTRSVRSELNRYASGEMLTRLLKRRFFEHTGKLPTENLTTFNEKITWAMMFDVNPLKTRCADKYLVRDYVTQKIGKKYLPELYGVYDSAESIDFNSLPQEFIISATHGWNQMMVIKDKESLDISGTRRKLNEWLLHDHFAGVCEMQYRFIPPKLIARELLKINEIEYNIFCFHGKVEYIQTIAYDPCHNALGTKYFTPQWVEEEFYSNIGKINKDTPKPHCLLEMLEIAMSLSSEFDFVRVDLFMLDDGSIRFCELTFSPAAGYMKFSSISSAKFIDEKFGSLWRLPERDEEGFSKQGRCILDPSTLQHF
jgi:acyl transferase domain-containing protein